MKSQVVLLEMEMCAGCCMLILFLSKSDRISKKWFWLFPPSFSQHFFTVKNKTELAQSCDDAEINSYNTPLLGLKWQALLLQLISLIKLNE